MISHRPQTPEPIRAAILAELARRKMTHADLAAIMGMARPNVSRDLARGLPWGRDKLELALVKLGLEVRRAR